MPGTFQKRHGVPPAPPFIQPYACHVRSSNRLPGWKGSSLHEGIHMVTMSCLSTPYTQEGIHAIHSPQRKRAAPPTTNHATTPLASQMDGPHYCHHTATGMKRGEYYRLCLKDTHEKILVTAVQQYIHVRWFNEEGHEYIEGRIMKNAPDIRQNTLKWRL